MMGRLISLEGLIMTAVCTVEVLKGVTKICLCRDGHQDNVLSLPQDYIPHGTGAQIKLPNQSTYHQKWPFLRQGCPNFCQEGQIW